MPHPDVVIIGGAVTGSSVAYHLAADPAFTGRAVVIEKDPSYQTCASALSAASIRQQFSTAVNVKISLYGIDFLREIGERLAVGGDRPAVDLHEGGYLFLATEAGRPILSENHALQTSLGADILFLEPDALVERFPWLTVEDIAAGCWGRTGEGWFDGYGLMQAFRKKARSLGVEYRAATATGVVTEGGRVTGVRLSDGEVIACGTVVNAAGAGGAVIARSAGVEIPIHVKKRMIFTFKCADPVERCPLLIDPNGTYVRPEGDGFLCGSAPPEDQDPDVENDFDVDWSLFEEVVWPTLAARVPAFERIRTGRAWAGTYDMCAWDHNVLLGPAPGVEGLMLANGFSGHGLQQSPAVGRGLAELIVHGRYVTLDLSDLSPSRILEGRKVAEKNVV
jgi:FAD-dependent oxidoreductase domain-containing protein 1